MQHADDRDAIGYHFVEDNITPERKTSYPWSQFLSAAAEHGLLGQEMEFGVDIVDERIRPRDTVFGDVVPELDQIISGTWTPQNDAHLRFRSTSLGGTFRTPFPLDLLPIPSRGGAAT